MELESTVVCEWEPVPPWIYGIPTVPPRMGTCNPCNAWSTSLGVLAKTMLVKTYYNYIEFINICRDLHLIPLNLYEFIKIYVLEALETTIQLRTF